MSTTQGTDSRHFSEVIVRGHCDRPAKLLAVRLCGEHIEVTRADPEKSIRLPITDLYRFDGALFNQLAEASADGDTKRLRELWARAEHFRPDGLSPE